MRYRSRVQVMSFLALLSAAAIVLSYYERFIPLPLAMPGMKLGLANTVTVASLYFFRKRQVFSIVIVRIIITTLLTGNVMGFVYSFAGGVVSFAGMALLHRFFIKWVSPVGISVMGAYLHNLGQLGVLAVVTGSITVAISYSPLIMISSMLTGVFVGITAAFFKNSVLGIMLRPQPDLQKEQKASNA